MACGYDFHGCALGRCHVWLESSGSVLALPYEIKPAFEFGERISSCETVKLVKILATEQLIRQKNPNGSGRFLLAMWMVGSEMQNFHVLIKGGLLSYCWSRFDGPDNGSPSRRIASGDQGYPDWTWAREEITATEVADYSGTINCEVVSL